MIRRVVLASLLAGLAFVAAKALPDVLRYFKIREM